MSDKYLNIKKLFNRGRESNPGWSDYICFAEAIRGRNVSKKLIRKRFNEMVDPSEYEQEDKKTILRFLFHLSSGK